MEYRRDQPTGQRLIDPYVPNQVGHSCYEMRMGPEAYVTGRRPESGRSLEKIKLEEGDQVAIPPGQFALLLAEEKVMNPKEAIGFISIRSSYKIHGLVNVSGFHVDPGYEGQLLFAVYNAGGNHVVISRGERVFLMWWASLTDDLDPGYIGSPLKPCALTDRGCRFRSTSQDAHRQSHDSALGRCSG